MIKDYRSILATKVMEFESGKLLALISGIIINPDTGMVEAFWVKPATLPIGNAILKVSDILEFKKNIYIKSDQILAEANDIIRINEILEEGRFFLGNNVQNEAGKSYGRCKNLTFDTKMYALKQIHTKKSILGLIILDQRIFSYENIVEVLPDKIIINDDSSKKESVMATTPETA